MPKRKAPPRNGFRGAKGRAKSKAGIPLDELLAAHAAGRPVRAPKTPDRAPAASKAPKTKPKKQWRDITAAPRQATRLLGVPLNVAIPVRFAPACAGEFLPAPIPDAGKGS